MKNVCVQGRDIHSIFMRRARFSMTQKYNDGHNNRSHCTAIGRSGANVTSFSSLRIALQMSSAMCSGLAPDAVVESVTKFVQVKNKN